MHLLILGANSDVAYATAQQFAANAKTDLSLASRDLELLEKKARDLEIRYGVKARAQDDFDKALRIVQTNFIGAASILEFAAADIFAAYRQSRDVVYTCWFWRWIMAVIKAIPESVYKRLSL